MAVPLFIPSTVRLISPPAATGRCSVPFVVGWSFALRMEAPSLYVMLNWQVWRYSGREGCESRADWGAKFRWKHGHYISSRMVTGPGQSLQGRISVESCDLFHLSLCKPSA